MNAVVGFQVLDDGTPVSIGLLLLSAIALFIGTGYIALDTAFSWTGHFAPSLNDPNRNIGLYVLYQLVPLIFLTLFFVLETILVQRVLGERKPMSTLNNLFTLIMSSLTRQSLPSRSSIIIRYWPNLPVCHQYPHLPRYEWQNQRRVIRDSLHVAIRGHDLGVLVEYHGRRLADACGNSSVHVAEEFLPGVFMGIYLRLMVPLAVYFILISNVSLRGLNI